MTHSRCLSGLCRQGGCWRYAASGCHSNRLSWKLVLMIPPHGQVLAGHEGPVSGLCFSPSRPLLASSSWDKTVRLWDVFGGKGNWESFSHPADGESERKEERGRKCVCLSIGLLVCLSVLLALFVTFRPDGKELAVATLDGQISFWDVER